MIINYSTKSLFSEKLDIALIPVFSGYNLNNDKALKELSADEKAEISKKMCLEGFNGGSGQRFIFHPEAKNDLKTIIWLGAGKKDSFEKTSVKHIAASALKSCKQLLGDRIGFLEMPLTEKTLKETRSFLSEGFHLSQYSFAKYKKTDKSADKKEKEISVLSRKTKKVSTSEKKQANKALSRGTFIAKAICHARDLVNTPAQDMYPDVMVKEAKSVVKGQASLKIKVLSAAECKKKGMNMFLAVGQGSDKESKFVHITYTPKKKPKKTIALVGKGVTFDSGGYSLKPSSSMMGMKVDMAGSAAVVASMAAVAEIGSPYEVHAVTALCENMVSGGAYKLGDVLTAMDGTTVEINNTDAEGRLTLGDALTYVNQVVEPDEIFDFATLTGACMVALGPYTIGVMSDHNKLANSWLQSCDKAGEDAWRLPLNKKLKKQLKSPIADLRNTGERYGGALTAGLFLQNFVKDTPWVHNDIAGPSDSKSTHGAVARGGTGVAVASIVNYCCEN